MIEPGAGPKRNPQGPRLRFSRSTIAGRKYAFMDTDAVDRKRALRYLKSGKQMASKILARV